jgi:hypothetical protein
MDGATNQAALALVGLGSCRPGCVRRTVPWSTGSAAASVAGNTHPMPCPIRARPHAILLNLLRAPPRPLESVLATCRAWEWEWPRAGSRAGTAREGGSTTMALFDTPAVLEVELVSNSSSSTKQTLALEVFG